MDTHDLLARVGLPPGAYQFISLTQHNATATTTHTFQSLPFSCLDTHLAWWCELSIGKAESLPGQSIE